MSGSPLRGLTHSELTAAFEAMHWRGWTLKGALSDPVRAKVLVARACCTRTRARISARRHRNTTTPTTTTTTTTTH